MAAVKTLAERIRDIRLKYEAHVAEINSSYELAQKDIKKLSDEIKGRDYATKYKQRYISLATEMSHVFMRIEEIERATHGLKFYVGDYLKTVRAESFAPEAAETFFEELAKKCNLCIKELEKGKAMEEYEADLKEFCRLCATAYYFSDNADRILAESGIPEGERAMDLAALSHQLEEVKQDYLNKIKFQSMPFYGEAAALIDEVRSSCSRIKEDMLGSGKFYYNRDYRYLLGFWKGKIPAEDAEFAKKVLDLTPSEISSQPIYFSPAESLSSPCNIVIDIHEKDFSSPVYLSFIKHLYCSVMSRLPKNSMLFGSIACDIKSKKNIALLQERILKIETGKSLSDSNYICRECVQNENGVRAALEYFNNKLLAVTTTVEIENNEQTAYALNLKAEQARQPLHYICVDNYPSGFSNMSSDSSQLLRQLMQDDAGKGFFVVVSQNVDASFSEKNPRITCAEKGLNALFVDMTDLAHIKINGREALTDITLPTFNENDFWQNLIG